MQRRICELQLQQDAQDDLYTRTATPPPLSPDPSPSHSAVGSPRLSPALDARDIDDDLALADYPAPDYPAPDEDDGLPLDGSMPGCSVSEHGRLHVNDVRLLGASVQDGGLVLDASVPACSPPGPGRPPSLSHSQRRAQAKRQRRREDRQAPAPDLSRKRKRRAKVRRAEQAAFTAATPPHLLSRLRPPPKKRARRHAWEAQVDLSSEAPEMRTWQGERTEWDTEEWTIDRLHELQGAGHTVVEWEGG